MALQDGMDLARPFLFAFAPGAGAGVGAYGS